MLAYNDIETFTFVFLYRSGDCGSLTESSSAWQILTRAGFQRKDGTTLALDLTQEGDTQAMQNPTLLSLNGGEAFLEYKPVAELGGDVKELQLGAARFHPIGIFADDRYTPDVRDSLARCAEQLACLRGFEVGFSLHLGCDEDEGEYRNWFSECVKSGRLSLPALVSHDWISIHSLFVGETYIDRYGRDVFLKCP